MLETHAQRNWIFGLGVAWVLVFFKPFQVFQMHSQYGKLVTHTNTFLTISIKGGQYFSGSEFSEEEER